MEYLMTYGWAILIIIIVVAVLFSLGVFNPSTYTQTTATGLSGFRVPQGGWRIDSSGAMTVQLENGVGAIIDVTEVNAKIGTTLRNGTIGTTRIAPGGTTTITFAFPAQPQGGAYSADLNVSYLNVDTGLQFKSFGTLTGTVT